MRARYSQIDGAGYMRRWRKGNRDKVNAMMRRWRAKQDWPALRKKCKQRLVDMLGGACMDCGYNEHLEALEFDHTDSDKEQSVATWLAQNRWKRAEEEARRCQLVCANCHRIRTAKRRDDVG